MNAPEHFAAVFVCDGKERYATKGRAIETIKRRQRRAKDRRWGSAEARRAAARLAAYRCDFCHQWHVGGHLVLKGVVR